MAVIVVVASLAVVAEVSLRGGSSPASTTAPSARPAANAFARAYVAYLTGRIGAAAVPDLSPLARAQATDAGRVPVAYRNHVTLRRLAFSGVLGARRASALLTAAAGSHTLEAALGLAYVGGRWEVSTLVPPDFPTVFSPPPPPIHVPSAVQTAARAFALAYANYRTGAAAAPPPGLASIRTQIATHQDPLAATAPSHSPARLVQLSALPQGNISVVDAVAATAGRRLSFSFIMQLAGGRWQASQFPESAQ